MVSSNETKIAFIRLITILVVLGGIFGIVMYVTKDAPEDLEKVYPIVANEVGLDAKDIIITSSEDNTYKVITNDDMEYLMVVDKDKGKVTHSVITKVKEQ